MSTSASLRKCFEFPDKQNCFTLTKNLSFLSKRINENVFFCQTGINFRSICGLLNSQNPPFLSVLFLCINIKSKKCFVNSLIRRNKVLRKHSFNQEKLY